MIEIFKHANYDFLGKKWIFIGLSWVLILAGVVSVAWRLWTESKHTSIQHGVDFSGTLVDVNSGSYRSEQAAPGDRAAGCAGSADSAPAGFRRNRPGSEERSSHSPAESAER
jgi:hypothetical protein